ncbi:MAG: hypothetical protein ACYS74_12360 [Planctomycetota bacterium]|jgi:DNA-binding transcriptional regulator YiaG
MGKLKGQILLETTQIKYLLEVIMYKKDLPSYMREQIRRIAVMAIAYIKLIQHSEQFHEKYDECFPALAKGICEEFYTDDLELAACFNVAPRTIREWRASYPDFNKAIEAGRRSFAAQGGSYVWHRRQFRRVFAQIAGRLRSEFSATNKQLAECFDVDVKELKQWLQADLGLLEELGGRVTAQVVGRICHALNPDDERLAHCLGISVKELEGWMQASRELSEQISLGSIFGSGEMRMFGGDNSQSSEPEFEEGPVL